MFLVGTKPVVDHHWLAAYKAFQEVHREGRVHLPVQDRSQRNCRADAGLAQILPWLFALPRGRSAPDLDSGVAGAENFVAHRRHESTSSVLLALPAELDGESQSSLAGVDGTGRTSVPAVGNSSSSEYLRVLVEKGVADELALVPNCGKRYFRCLDFLPGIGSLLC